MGWVWLLLIAVVLWYILLGWCIPRRGGAGWNEPVLLGPEQNGETQRGKTVGTRIIQSLPDPHHSARKLTCAVVASSDVQGGGG